MAPRSKTGRKKYIPGSDGDAEEIFDFPFTVDDTTIKFLLSHGRVMFIVRGPPGTAKDSLSKMLQQCYPSNTVCSADNYFQESFTKSRDTETMKRSHEFCHKMVEKACLKNAQCIIVKNTHMRKREMQKYLDLAAKYIYVVIMAITLDKFSVNPEILAKSNNKGLTKDYFQSRLRQWEDVVPVHTGWFTCPADASFILSQLETGLDALLGDGKFCRIMNAYAKDALLRSYKVRKMLYCIAACGERNSSSELKSYYLSENVKKHYGKSFTLIIHGYIITPSWAVAVCYLDETMKSLQFIKTCVDARESDEDSLVQGLQCMSVNENFSNHCSTKDFTEDTKRTAETALLAQRDPEETINYKYSSFMYLAESSKHLGCIPKISTLFDLLASTRDENGDINADMFVELEDNFMVCRLSSEAWLVKPPLKITVKTVFTGLYI